MKKTKSALSQWFVDRNLEEPQDADVAFNLYQTIVASESVPMPEIEAIAQSAIDAVRQLKLENARLKSENARLKLRLKIK